MLKTKSFQKGYNQWQDFEKYCGFHRITDNLLSLSVSKKQRIFSQFHIYYRLIVWGHTYKISPLQTTTLSHINI